ncbi:MAG: biotin/lipoyl-containing protein [Bacillota bacterium]
MKRKLKITVAGNTYEVEVEEVVGQETPQKTNSPVMPVNPTGPAPISPKQAPAAPSAAPVGDGERVKAPIPGKVLSIKVRPGDQVNSGDLVLVLEAMKMENEISAPVSGEIKQVLVSEGQSVNTGDPMVVIG